jgi:hypothetical protein
LFHCGKKWHTGHVVWAITWPRFHLPYGSCLSIRQVTREKNSKINDKKDIAITTQEITFRINCREKRMLHADIMLWWVVSLYLMQGWLTLFYLLLLKKCDFWKLKNKLLIKMRKTIVLVRIAKSNKTIKRESISVFYGDIFPWNNNNKRHDGAHEPPIHTLNSLEPSPVPVHVHAHTVLSHPRTIDDETDADWWLRVLCCSRQTAGPCQVPRVQMLDTSRPGPWSVRRDAATCATPPSEARSNQTIGWTRGESVEIIRWRASLLGWCWSLPGGKPC